MRYCKILLMFFLVGSATYGKDVSSSAGVSLKKLRSQLASHVSQRKFASAEWGVEVLSLDSGKVIWETNSQKLLKPASNTKLYTGAMALNLFGPDYRIRTSIYAKSKPDEQGTLHGDLIVYGRGDFSMAARFHNGEYGQILGPAMRAIEAAGIKKIEGDLIGDDTYFRGPRQGAGWSWDDLEYYYGAEASALTIQDNVIDLWIRPGEKAGLPCVIEGKPETSFVRFVNRTTSSSGEGKGELSIYRPLGENIAYISGNLPLKHAAWVDSVTVSKPALWFVTLLKSALPSEMVKGDVKSRSWPVEAALQTNDFIELAHFESPPLSELLPKMLKPSQNLYAQLLLLQAGATSARSSDTNRTTEELGLEALHAFVARAGINPKEVLLEEGSGLSRSGLVTPHATVELLQFMHREVNAKLFHDCLAEPGSEGTLRRRLKELKGNLFAKTGSLSYVDSLSGYMKSAAGEELAFSIMLNAYNEESASKAREDLDVIPRLLGRLNQKSDR